MLASISLNDFSISSNTGEKPQSKVWTHDDQWWSVMPNGNGTWVWRLDGTNWTPTLQLTSDSSVHADVKAAGDLAHILLYDGSQSQLASVQYDDAANDYSFWSVRPELVDIVLSSGVETATIDLDSTGRMWLASDAQNSVEVRYSDGDFGAWSAPITLAQDISGDDISAISALPNDAVGVMWSNQNNDRFGFRIHQDGDPVDVWSADEVPASQSALSVGGGMADDHLNLAVSSDGTVFAAVKTGYDSSSQAEIALLVRRPGGVWEDLHFVDNKGTRPIVVVNESMNRLLVAYTSSDSGGNILYRESPLNFIDFGAEETLISGGLNNATSTKQNFVDEVVVLASSGGSANGVLFSFDPPPVNQPPIVDAGLDDTAPFGTATTLDGTVTDDGLPAPPGNVAVQWTKVSGPGSVSFADDAAVDTTATFGALGTYVLRLTADDGQLIATSDVTITVVDPPPQPVTMAFQYGVNGYQGARDTKIKSTDPGTNYAGDTNLEADGSPDQAILLAWDISSIPVGSLVDAATLTVNITNGTSQNYELYALQQPWSETQATWQQYANGSPWSADGADGPADHGSDVLGQLAPNGTGTSTITLNNAGVAAVQAWVNNPAINYGLIIKDYVNASNGTDLHSREHSNASQRPKLEVTYAPPGGQTNQPPTVSAGPDQTINIAGAATLDGTVTDDGLPAPPGNVAVQWTKVSGPGSVSFADGNAVDTTATFDAAGTYILRLIADDGEFIATDDTVIDVQAPTPNQPPTVSAGPDQTIDIAGAATLDGTVTDDGLPAPPGNVAVQWTKVSGPGSVSFANAAAVDTTATFGALGTYVLRLTADDGQLIATSDVTITVVDPPPQPVTMAFQYGVNGYQGARDTKIKSTDPGTNYAGDTNLEADGSPDQAILLAWDISSIPVGSLVDAATLTVNITNGTSQNYELYALQQPWSETQATWQQYANGSPWSADGADGPADHGSDVLGQLAPNGTGTSTITLNNAGVAAVQAWVNNPAINYGLIIKDYVNASNGTDLHSREHSNASQRPKLEVTYAPPGGQTNQPPTVSAGPDQTINIAGAATLDGTVTDDGLPAPPGNVAVQWTKVSGPGSVSFADGNAVDTTATFDAAGTYILRLIADDGEFIATDDTVIDVQAPTPNQPPTVSAGPDQTIDIAGAATLDGTVTDDGLPAPPGNVAVQWTKVSGPGSVSFADDAAVDTTATFGALGTYVLRLTADDGQLIATSDVTITVVDPPPQPVTMAFQYGVNGYQGARDTKIKSTDPGTNYAGDTNLEADGSPDQAILLAWDISSIPVGSLVDAATLTVNITNGTSQNYELYALQQPWSETQATWQQYANGSPWSADGADGPADHGSDVLGQLAPNGTGTSTITLNNAGVAAVQAWVNNPAINYGLIIKDYVNASNGTDLHSREHSNASQRPKLEVTYAPPGGQTNQPPTVSAGPDQTINIAGAATLDGTVTDDGLPAPPGNVAVQWTKVSGPGSVSFADGNAVDTTATFDAAGTYILRLTADDGSLAATSDTTITVNRTPDPTSGLVGHWTLDTIVNGCLADLSGLGHKGTVVGNPQPIAGPVATALRFDGSSDLITIQDNHLLDTGDQITITAWVKPETVDTQYVVKKARHNSVDGYEVSLSSSGKVFVRFNQNSNSNAYRVDSTSSYPSDGNTWIHAAAVYDGTTISLYIDGQLESAETASFQIAANDLPLSLGSQDDGFRKMTGGMDDVRIYDRALDADEILALFQQT